MSTNMNDLTEVTYELRQNVLDIVMSGKGGHIGGDMSVLDILTVLYFRVMNVSPDKKDDPGRDRFIMSKGHSVEALYAVLAAKGFFPLQEVLERFSRFGSPYIGHPNSHLPGIEMNSGSYCHGLPVSVGMALAGKMDQASYRFYTLWGMVNWRRDQYGKQPWQREIGAAYGAGLAVGLYDERIFERINRLAYEPLMRKSEREELYEGWKNAVRSVLGK